MDVERKNVLPVRYTLCPGIRCVQAPCFQAIPSPEEQFFSQEQPDFAQQIRQYSIISEEIMVSFDVKCLFTSIPVNLQRWTDILSWKFSPRPVQCWIAQYFKQHWTGGKGRKFSKICVHGCSSKHYKREAPPRATSSMSSRTHKYVH